MRILFICLFIICLGFGCIELMRDKYVVAVPAFLTAFVFAIAIIDSKPLKKKGAIHGTRKN